MTESSLGVDGSLWVEGRGIRALHDKPFGEADFVSAHIASPKCSSRFTFTHPGEVIKTAPQLYDEGGFGGDWPELAPVLPSPRRAGRT